MRFKTFIIFAVAVAVALGGYSLGRLEGVTSSNRQQIQQHNVDNCKLKLFDLASGYVQRAQLIRSNPREAEVLTGALRVVLSIPSAKSCVPAVRFALEHAHGHSKITNLSPRVEHELVKLATAEAPSSTSAPVRRGSGGGRRVVPQPTPRRPVPKAPRPAPHEAPHITVTVPAPAPTPAPREHGNGNGKGQESGRGKVETPPVKTPPAEAPPVTLPPVEVPPITVEVPALPLPCVQVGTVHVNCKK